MLNFLKVNYPIDTDAYTEVTAYDFNKLSEIAEENSHRPEFYLDELYKDKKINIRTCSDEFYKYVPRNMLNGNPHKERARKELYDEDAVTEACLDFEVCEELKPYFDATVRLNDDKVIPELLKYTYKKFADDELNTEECKRIFECLAYFNNEELYTACGLENERNDFSKRKENKLLGKKLEEHGLAYLSESGDSLQLTQFGKKFFKILRQDIIFIYGL